jgi:hypothetical protein
MSLYQFLGGLLQSCPDRESSVAVILEELTRIARITPEDDKSNFHNDIIKPIIKSVVYILTIKHNILLEDTKQAFGDSNTLWPKPVKESILEQKQLINSLNEYIDKL